MNIDDERLVWAPTTASAEFPDDDAVRQANIELPLPLAQTDPNRQPRRPLVDPCRDEGRPIRAANPTKPLEIS